VEVPLRGDLAVTTSVRTVPALADVVAVLDAEPAADATSVLLDGVPLALPALRLLAARADSG
jgi:hypothetical protein